MAASLPVLNNIEHELVVEQPDEVEAAEAGSGAECEVPDDHAGVEGPPEKELPGGLGEVWLVKMRSKNWLHHILQPRGPSLQTGLFIKVLIILLYD